MGFHPNLVTSEQDVTENIVTLRRYQDERESEKRFHDGLIKKGRLLVVGKYENEYAFSPSRFAGYRSNTRLKHARRQDSDGIITNPAINKIFGPQIDKGSNNSDLYNTIDAEFDSYCNHNNITPAKTPNPRKYWLASGMDYMLRRTINSEPYLECHHIIAPAMDGADRVKNVIALCPNDHREAHFCKRRHEPETEMISKVKKFEAEGA